MLVIPLHYLNLQEKWAVRITQCITAQEHAGLHR
jgi:hypothetical protein